MILSLLSFALSRKQKWCSFFTYGVSPVSLHSYLVMFFCLVSCSPSRSSGNLISQFSDNPLRLTDAPWGVCHMSGFRVKNLFFFFFLYLSCPLCLCKCEVTPAGSFFFSSIPNDSLLMLCIQNTPQLCITELEKNIK